MTISRDFQPDVKKLVIDIDIRLDLFYGDLPLIVHLYPATWPLTAF